MRRAQSVRTYPRASLNPGPNVANDPPAADLSVLRESGEPTSVEDALRKQLLEKDRENDKLQSTILALQTQLAARPPIETIQCLDKEYKNLDLILQGTQRENERCMAELERARTRERLLEQALAKVAGENWQTVLDVGPGGSSGSGSVSGTTTAAVAARVVGSSLNRSTAASPMASEVLGSPSAASQASVMATLSQIEQIRLLVLGMEQRMQEREEKLTRTVERAETQEAKCEALRREILPTKVVA